MGKGEKAKRLANPVSKMTDALMADFPEFPRPVHEAVGMKKIICPEQNCCENMIFFEEGGWVSITKRFVKRCKCQGNHKGTVQDVGNLWPRNVAFHLYHL